MEETPQGKTAVTDAATSNSKLYDPNTEKDIIDLKKNANAALAALVAPGALHLPSTKALLTSVGDSLNKVSDDVRYINSGLQETLTHFNKNSPEYKAVSQDYNRLNSLYNDLAAEKIALNEVIASNDAAKVKEQLEKIAITEKSIHFYKTKAENDVAMLYYKQPIINTQGSNIENKNYKINRPDSIMIIF